MQKIITSDRIAISTKREEVESKVNSSVVGLAAVHEAARLAQEGHYEEARIHLISVQRVLQRSMKTLRHEKDYFSFIVQAEKLDQFMREAVASSNSGPTNLRASLEDSALLNRDDDASKSIYQLKNLALADFHKQL